MDSAPTERCGDQAGPQEKRCPHCGAVKNLTEFAKNPATKSGRASWCKKCMAAYVKERGYVKHRPKPPNIDRRFKPLSLTKTCTRCGETYPATAQFFHRGKGSGGLVSWCKNCMRQYSQAWNETNREKISVKSKRWYAQNRERARRNIRKNDLRRRTGATIEYYDRLFAEQEGKCAICGKPQDQNLAVDHDHNTGALRGLLCLPHNSMIGFAGDDPEILQKGIEYLKFWADKTPR